jgi:hypothetical protein
MPSAAIYVVDKDWTVPVNCSAEDIVQAACAFGKDRLTIGCDALVLETVGVFKPHENRKLASLMGRCLAFAGQQSVTLVFCDLVKPILGIVAEIPRWITSSKVPNRSSSDEHACNNRGTPGWVGV